MACLGIALIGSVLGGCVTEETTSNRPRYDQVLNQTAPTGFGDPTPPPTAAARPLQQARPPSGRAPTTSAAPIVAATCQGALDEICTALLIHYKVYNRMPDQLEDLRKFKEFGNIGDLRCPVSKRPYVYYPQGLRVADEELLRERKEPVRIATYVIVADPTPAHGGVRYAIFIQRPEGAEDIQARIGILPND